MGLVSAMGYVDEEGNFPRAKQAFAADALATMFGSVFSLSPVTSYIESGAGVEAGARTGLTACFCGLFFFLSIFFAPISKFLIGPLSYCAPKKQFSNSTPSFSPLPPTSQSHPFRHGLLEERSSSLVL